MKYVQFSDSTQSAVVSVFSCPQDASVWPNQGTVADDDPRYLAFADPGATLKGAQDAQTITISAACQTEIYAGFESSALGSAHHYPALASDQRNLAAGVLESIAPGLPAGWTTPFWCQDSVGNWSLTQHTAVQIQQVSSDFRTAVVTAQAKNAQLAAQVQAATTVSDVQKITW